jgi:hypothetical protein
MINREIIINKLKQLPEPFLEKIDKFLSFLIAQQQVANIQSEVNLTDRWNQWFEEVDQLTVSTQQPENEYQKRLIEKYQKQGIKL